MRKGPLVHPILNWNCEQEVIEGKSEREERTGDLTEEALEEGEEGMARDEAEGEGRGVLSDDRGRIQRLEEGEIQGINPNRRSAKKGVGKRKERKEGEDGEH